MEAGMAGIGDIAVAAVGVGAAGGGLARVAGGFGEELQAASQTTNTASRRILPFGAFIRISPLANAYGNRGRIVTPIPLAGSPQRALIYKSGEAHAFSHVVVSPCFGVPLSVSAIALPYTALLRPLDCVVLLAAGEPEELRRVRP